MAAPHEQSSAKSIEQIIHDIQSVNEQLVFASLREQASAEQLRHQLAFVSAITTSLGDGVLAVDRAGQCTFINPAAERLLGWTNAEVHGKEIHRMSIEIAADPANTVLSTLLHTVFQSGVIQRDEDAQFMHRDQGVFPVALSVAPISTDGQVIGAVVTFRDVTEVRRLQHIREEYMALISHDLRSPLTVILGYAQLLLRRLSNDGFAREVYAATILVESSLRMRDMIEDLVDRNRMDAVAEDRHRVPTDLATLVQRMIHQALPPDHAPRVTLHAPVVPPVIADVGQIERVVVNLLANAIKFSAPDTPIRVQVYHQDFHVIITVIDQGVGIAPEDLPRLFEKHYRAQSVGQIAGDGLGLYGSRLIVEAHGGRLSVKSTLGAGSTFMVALPLPTSAVID